jgi:hypothetical protein
VIANALDPNEAVISLPMGKSIQRALCVTGPINGDFGKEGSPTRVAIKDFKSGFYFPTEAKDGILKSPQEVDAVSATARSLGGCQRVGLANAFEAGVVSKPEEGVPGLRRRLATAIDAEIKANRPITADAALVTTLNQKPSAQGKAIDLNARMAIKALRKAYGLEDTEFLTLQFYNKLRNATSN